MAAYLSWAGHILKDIQLPLSTKMLVSEMLISAGVVYVVIITTSQNPATAIFDTNNTTRSTQSVFIVCSAV